MLSYTVGMVSLGCSKNQVDGEVLLASLKNAGFAISADLNAADAVIVNTCGFIESAKKESIDEILNMAQLKQEGKLKAVIVTGCLAERYQTEIRKELPEADAVFGIGANHQIAGFLTQILEGKSMEVFPPKLELPLQGERILSTPPYSAYLKISEGCDNCCSYCAIPLIRGRFRSRTIEDVVEEAGRLVANGVRELIVIAQDTTRFGEDLYGKPVLTDLLRELCRLEGLHWVRLLYCYPNRISDELLDLIASEPKILKYIDLPLQHCSGRVLRDMNRFGDRESLRALIRKMREKIPGLVLRTTFITGFPGETLDDFEELAEFVQETRFERLGCFPYSQEEDTPAAEFENQIPEEEKQRRADLIMEIQMTIMQQLGDGLCGKTLEVLVEGYDSETGFWYGRSYADSPDIDGSVLFTVSGDAPPVGSFCKVQIDQCVSCDLIGSLLQAEGHL